MNEEYQKIIENSIKDSFTSREKYFNFMINNNAQLELAQLDLFKTIATLTIALASIGYLYVKNIEPQFLIISLFSAGVAFILSISYTREIIDIQSHKNNKSEEEVYRKTEISINKALESIKKDDANIFFNSQKSN